MKKGEVKSVWLSNIPNLLSISRIVLTFVVMYMIFVEANVISIIVVFAVAALTDFFDGQLARRFNWVSEFGRKADMIADRFLWTGTALVFVISFGLRGELRVIDGVQLIFLMSREMISMPFAILAFMSDKPIPHARYIAKVTTFIQGFAMPAIILSIFYPKFIYVSLPLSIVVLILGTISGMYYIYDIQQPIVQVKKRNKK